MKFVPGQQVVCVEPKRGRLVLHRVYVVERFYNRRDKTGHYGVVIQGVRGNGRFNAWRASRFKPVDDSKLDQFREVVQQVLTSAPKVSA